jgi:hypothetical protein
MFFNNHFFTILNSMLSLIFENLYLGVLEINLIFKVGFIL